MIRIQIMLELEGILCCLLLIAGSVFNKVYRSAVGRTVLAILGLLLVILTGDMMTYYCGGKPELRQLCVAALTAIYMAIAGELIVCAYYVHLILQRKHLRTDRRILYTIWAIQGICVIGILLTPFTGLFFTISEYGFYHAGRAYGFLSFCFLISWCLIVWPVIRYKAELARLWKTVIPLSLLPLVGTFSEILWPGYSVVNLLMVFMLIGLILVEMFEAMQERRRRELQLVQNRTYLLNSQIKPHFLFNSLNVIRALIEEDPEIAYDAVGHLSKFLRSGMIIENVQHTVPLEKELDYVKHYLYLEQLRFGEKLKTVWDIEDGIHFALPFLSIQPVVENAVRHGVCKKVDGGTVTIRIWTEYRSHVIRVEDDGAGFDVKQVMSEASRKQRREEGHGVGLENVMERLRLISDASLEIVSSPERGTWVTITIPKR